MKKLCNRLRKQCLALPNKHSNWIRIIRYFIVDNYGICSHDVSKRQTVSGAVVTTKTTQAQTLPLNCTTLFRVGSYTGSRLQRAICFTTRMHSSRMRTARLLSVSCSAPGGVCPTPLDADLPSGCRPPSTLDADPPPPVDRMTDAGENITFANFVCGR